MGKYYFVVSWSYEVVKKEKKNPISRSEIMGMGKTSI